MVTGGRREDLGKRDREAGPAQSAHLPGRLPRAAGGQVPQWGPRRAALGGRGRVSVLAGSQALAPSLMDVEGGNLDTLGEYGTCHGQTPGAGGDRPPAAKWSLSQLPLGNRETPATDECVLKMCPYTVL